MEEKRKVKKTALKPSADQSSGQNGQRKATYEELNNYCVQLHEQNQALIQEVRKRDMANLLSRLNYLFMVLANKDSFSEDFVKACAAEIEHAITGPTEEEREVMEKAKAAEGKEA